MFFREARKVLIVDDHSLMREGLRSLLEDIPMATVVGEAKNGHEAVTLCRVLQPAVVLMDLNLPECDGIEAIRQIARRFPNIHIIVVTASNSEVRAAEALDAGASGYMLKRSGRKELAAALEAIEQDQEYLDPTLDESLVRETIAKMVREGRQNLLTRREIQVLKLIAEGNGNRQIAENLLVSLKTVETHRLNLMQKLDAHNAADLTRWAYRLDLLTDDTPPA